jgi:hypothetical protein
VVAFVLRISVLSAPALLLACSALLAIDDVGYAPEDGGVGALDEPISSPPDAPVAPTEAGDDAAPDADRLGAVHGHVVDAHGLPVANAHVRIGGASIATDTLGAFVLTAPAAYDASVVYTFAKHPPSLTQYRGLTRRDPVLQLPEAPSLVYTMSLSGALIGATSTGLGNASYGFSSEAPSISWGTAITGTNSYSIPIAEYYGLLNGTGHAYVLQSSDTTGSGPRRSHRTARWSTTS